MRKRILSEALAKAGIYLLTSLTVFAFLFFLMDARSYSAASPQAAAGAGTIAPGAATPQPLTALAAAEGGAPSPDAQPLPRGTTPEAPLPAEALPEAGASEEGPAQGGGEQVIRQPADGPEIDLAAIQAEISRIETETGLALPAALDMEYMGQYHATAYCCEVYKHICGGNGVTASGTVPTPGLTVAADWGVLPRNTWLYIEGVGVRRVEDTGSAIKQQRLDIAVDTHANALGWPGFGRHEVWVLAWPGFTNR